MAKLFRFSFQIDGGQRMDRALSLMAEQVDLRLAATKLQEVFNRHRKKDFDRQGSWSGPRWAELEPMYRMHKLLLFPGRKILQRTQNLIVSLISPNHPDAVFTASRNSVTMGTTDHKAIYHQYGTRRMPARPPLRMKESERREYMQVIHTEMVAALELENRGGALRRLAVPPRSGFGTAPRTGGGGD